MKNSLVVIFVLHEKIKPYIDDFIDSLNYQTCKAFDVVWFDDGYNGDIVVDNQGACIRVSEKGLSPFQVRVRLFSKVKAMGYESVVCCDADDILGCNRLFYVSQYIHKYDFLVNNCDLIDEKNQVISKNFFMSCEKFDIFPGNIFGLSNTAFKVKALDFELFECDTVIFDWLFFSMLFISKKSFFFLPQEAKTLYRIGYQNLLGLGMPKDIHSLLRLARMKYQHYEALEFNIKANTILCSPIEIKRLAKLKKEALELVLLTEDLANESREGITFKYDKDYRLPNGWWSNITLQQYSLKEVYVES